MPNHRSARNLSAAVSRETRMIEKYLDRIRDQPGRPDAFAYRGQRNGSWSLESAATRALRRQSAAMPSPEEHVEYHRNLVARARTGGFGVENGHEVTDLQLLAKLQHFGAPTGLLDFSWNPLVALWFASDDPGSDGKLFLLNTADIVRVGRLPDERQDIARVFSGEKEPSAWEPTLGGDAMSRILVQRSLFGRPFIPRADFHEIEVSKNDKMQLREDLALLDFRHETLFRDIYGFAQAEAAKTEMARTGPGAEREPVDYLKKASRLFWEGDIPNAVIAYDRYILIHPHLPEAYFFRGLSKRKLGLASEAITDYDEAIRLARISRQKGSHRASDSQYM